MLEKSKMSKKWGRDIDPSVILGNSSNLSTRLLALPSGRIFLEHSTYVSHQQALGSHPCTGIPDMFPMSSDITGMPFDIPDMLPTPSMYAQIRLSQWAWDFPRPKNRSDHTALWLVDISGYKLGVVRIDISASTDSEKEAMSSDSSTSFILQQTTWVFTSWKRSDLPSPGDRVWMNWVRPGNQIPIGWVGVPNRMIPI